MLHPVSIFILSLFLSRYVREETKTNAKRNKEKRGNTRRNSPRGVSIPRTQLWLFRPTRGCVPFNFIPLLAGHAHPHALLDTFGLIKRGRASPPNSACLFALVPLCFQFHPLCFQPSLSFITRESRVIFPLRSPKSNGENSENSDIEPLEVCVYLYTEEERVCAFGLIFLRDISKIYIYIFFFFLWHKSFLSSLCTQISVHKNARIAALLVIELLVSEYRTSKVQ